MSTPAISVLVPAFNAAPYVGAAVGSILSQTFTDLECIVVDDGSRDRTRLVLDKLAAADRRLRIVSRENRGLVSTLNELISLARGRYLARMDADDLAHPERLARQFARLEADPACVAVGSDVILTAPDGRALKLHRLPASHEAIRVALLEGNGGAMIHPAVTFRASAVRAVGGYDNAFAGYGEDWDIFLRLSETGHLANISYPLLDYRLHHKSYNQTRADDAVRTFLGLVNRRRDSHGLPPIDRLPHQRPGADRAATLNQWSCWAMEGRRPLTALSLLRESLLAAPLRRETWRLLKYCLFHAPSHDS